MEVFVINLKQDLERRISITNQLNQFNLKHRIVDAVDGTKLTVDDYNRIVNKDAIINQSGWLTKGAIGCAMSHLKVYETIVEEGLEYGLVLEDDCIINSDLQSILDVVHKFVKDGEILLLNYKSRNKIILKPILDLSPLKYSLCELNQLVHISSAAAYVVSKKAAKAMVLNRIPIRAPSDNWQNFLKHKYIDGIKFVYPQPISSFPFKSSIDYVDKKSIIGLLISFIEEYKLFPIYQLLRYRRKRLLLKLNQVELFQNK